MPDLILHEKVQKDEILDYEKMIRKIVGMHHFSEGFFQQVTLLANTDETIGEIYTEFVNAILEEIQHLLSIK